MFTAVIQAVTKYFKRSGHGSTSHSTGYWDNPEYGTDGIYENDLQNVKSGTFYLYSDGKGNDLIHGGSTGNDDTDKIIGEIVSYAGEEVVVTVAYAI